MLKTLYQIQTTVDKMNIKLISKISYRLLLYLIRVFVPIYYKANPIDKNAISKNNDINEEYKIIISLTTFPPRMKSIWMVLESLLRQTKKPDKIILWLASSQFSSLEDVDIRVRKMQERGLEIRFCNDYKSHKKYYYTMKEYRNDIVILADDDIFYPEDMVANLVNRHKDYPDCIVCYRAHRITFTAGMVDKYSEWDHLAKGISGPDNLLIATTGGGTLYPPNCLHSEVFNSKAIQEMCPNADDIWLKCMSYLKGTQTVKVHSIFSEVFTTSGSADSGLAIKNVVDGYNDVQLKNVISRYNIVFSENNKNQYRY